ncbi:MAG TPA: radical SAM family heme chaperone HemW [Polyangiaceae bacterium]|jgi:oxygen-independent coproporphyrinogen-3 oxidase|nr:radical SAM family heme chaperone HemW [Polyangiaceae bacterium]
MAAPANFPAPRAQPVELGVYVHFPWCLKKCPYCDFLSVASERPAIPHAAYADSVIAELERRAELLPRARLLSVFFGGGTPSLWEPHELGRVLARILTLLPDHADDLEVTVECNPTSFDLERAHALQSVGVNRVSIGVQGLDASRLEFLGRLHDVNSGLEAVRTALASGMPRVSADFIFGVSGQAADAARREAQILAALGTTHLSAYALTIEPGTQFGALARKGKLPLLDEAAVADSFLAVEETLERAGFEHYEISNYAKPGARSRHNLGYWLGRSYLGLGTGAWGTLDGPSGRYRYRNTPSPERYLAGRASFASLDLSRAGPLVANFEPIARETALAERIMLGLRLADGVDLDRAETELGAELWTPERARARDKLVAQGKLTLCGGVASIPKPHWLFADGIIAELI